MRCPVRESRPNDCMGPEGGPPSGNRKKTVRWRNSLRRLLAKRVCWLAATRANQMGTLHRSRGYTEMGCFKHAAFEFAEPIPETFLEPGGLLERWVIPSSPGHVQRQEIQDRRMIKVRGVNQFVAGKGMPKPLEARDEGRFGEQIPELGGDVTGMFVCSVDQPRIQFC